MSKYADNLREEADNLDSLASMCSRDEDAEILRLKAAHLRTLAKQQAQRDPYGLDDIDEVNEDAHRLNDYEGRYEE